MSIWESDILGLHVRSSWGINVCQIARKTADNCAILWRKSNSQAFFHAVTKAREKTQEGCGGLGGEHPGMFPKAGSDPIFAAGSAKTSAGLACCAAGESGRTSGEKFYMPPPPPIPHFFGQKGSFREGGGGLYILKPQRQEFYTPPLFYTSPTPRRVLSRVGGWGCIKFGPVELSSSVKILGGRFEDLDF